MPTMTVRYLVSVLVAVAILLMAQRATRPSIPNGHWVNTWVSMPQLTEPATYLLRPFTIRQTMHMSIGAEQIRVRISNAFGTTDLPITAVTVALPYNGSAAVSAIQPDTVTTLTFSGSASAVIPNGAMIVSDPINFPIKPQSNRAVTIYMAGGQPSNYITSHPGSQTTSWFSSGNWASSINLTDPSKKSAAHWYFVSSVEAWVPRTTRAFAIVGDSITDGHLGTTDQNNRWPDRLLARMQPSGDTASIAVLNQAAGGNRILVDGLGPNVLGRINRDVLAHSGVRYAMLFEGVNDIGTSTNTTAAQRAVGDRLLWSYRQIATRVHAQAIPILVATITPFSAPANASAIQPYSDPTREATRQRVNTWIRASSMSDAVVDFHVVLRDPANPTQLNPCYGSGDYLHPNLAGYQALADAFPLSLFAKFADGVDGFS